MSPNDRPTLKNMKIEVTPQMIEAGALELFILLGPYENAVPSYSEVAEFVFRKMASHWSAAFSSRKRPQ